MKLFLEQPEHNKNEVVAFARAVESLELSEYHAQQETPIIKRKGLRPLLPTSAGSWIF